MSRLPSVAMLFNLLALSPAMSAMLRSHLSWPQEIDCINEFLQDCTEIKNCAELRSTGSSTKSGVYTIKPRNHPSPFNVYCDMTTDGGGWTVFQRRLDGSIGFFLEWDDYKEGFGEIHSEFWLGNDKLADLSSQAVYELRVDLSDFDGAWKYAAYDYFKVDGETSEYILSLGQYSGNAGDSLTKVHKGRPFSTKDRGDSDHCAQSYKGGWWYGNCHQSNLNGLYLAGETTVFAEGVVWYSWHGHYYSLKTAEMKIRRIA